MDDTINYSNVRLDLFHETEHHVKNLSHIENTLSALYNVTTPEYTLTYRLLFFGKDVVSFNVDYEVFAHNLQVKEEDKFKKRLTLYKGVYFTSFTVDDLTKYLSHDADNYYIHKSVVIFLLRETLGMIRGYITSSIMGYGLFNQILPLIDPVGVIDSTSKVHPLDPNKIEIEEIEAKYTV